GEERGGGDAAELELLGVAHVEDEQVLAPVEALLQVLDGDLALAVAGRGRRLLAAQAAELLVVDQLRDRRPVAADRALRVAPDLELAERHLHRVVRRQPAEERLALAQDQLHRLGRLDAADQAGQDAEDAALGAARYFAGRRRLREEAAVARAVRRVEHRRLAVEAEDAAV